MAIGDTYPDPWQHEGVVSLLCGDDVFLVVILICEDHRSRVWILVRIDANDYVVLHGRYLNPTLSVGLFFGPDLVPNDRCVHAQGQTSTYTIVTIFISNTDELHAFPDVIPRLARRSLFCGLFLSVGVLFCCVVSSCLSFSVVVVVRASFFLDRCVCCLVCHVSYFSFDRSNFSQTQQLRIETAAS